MSELHIILHVGRSDTAPVDHDEIASLWLQNLKADLLQHLEHPVAPRLITTLQALVKAERQIQSSRGSGLERRSDGNVA